VITFNKKTIDLMRQVREIPTMPEHFCKLRDAERDIRQHC